MKLPTNQLSKFARAVFAKKVTTSRNRLVHPERDWLIGVLIGVGILIGVMAWSAYMYISNRSGEANEADVTANATPTYRASVVEEALRLFADRAEQFSVLSAQTNATVPPPTPAEIAVTNATTTNSTTTEAGTGSNTNTTQPDTAPATTSPAEDQEMNDPISQDQATMFESDSITAPPPIFDVDSASEPAPAQRPVSFE